MYPQIEITFMKNSTVQLALVPFGGKLEFFQALGNFPILAGYGLLGRGAYLGR
jgi:hypothetical protein